MEQSCEGLGARGGEEVRAGGTTAGIRTVLGVLGAERLLPWLAECVSRLLFGLQRTKSPVLGGVVVGEEVFK